MSQELKTVTINSLGETKKYDFPINGKVSDIKSFYENNYGFEFYFKIIKGTDVLADEFLIADIDEDITIVIINIADELKKDRFSTRDEFILNQNTIIAPNNLSNFIFSTEDKCISYVEKIKELINIDPASILLKICKIFLNEHKKENDSHYNTGFVFMYIEFRNNITVNYNLENIQLPNIEVYRYGRNGEFYTFSLKNILIEYDKEFDIWSNYYGW